MKHNFKWFGIIALAVIIGFTMVACGGDSKPTPPTVKTFQGTIAITGDGYIGKVMTANYTKAGDDPATVTYKWTKGTSTTPLGTGGTTYTPTEAGEYYVTISAENYNDKKSAKFDVIAEPENEFSENCIVIAPTLPTLTPPYYEGTSLTAIYTPDTDDPAEEDISYQWYKDGIPLTDKTETVLVANLKGVYKVRITAPEYKFADSNEITVEEEDEGGGDPDQVAIFKAGVELQGDGKQTGNKMDIDGAELNALKAADPLSYIVIKASASRADNQWFGQINSYIQTIADDDTSWEPFGISPNGNGTDELKFTLAEFLAKLKGEDFDYDWNDVGSLQIELDSAITVVSVYFYEFDKYVDAVDAAEPAFTVEIEGEDWNKAEGEWDIANEENLTLTVTLSNEVDCDVLTYEWYICDADGENEVLQAEDSAALELSFDDYKDEDMIYIYVIVTNEDASANRELTASKQSELIVIKVVDSTP
jgi:hypothetical protein